jgi:putative ABC transport system permease protein
MRRRFWPQGDAMGRSIRVMTSPPVTAAIIGVVGNIKNTGPEESEQLQFYAPQTQFPFIFNTLAVRTKGDPLAMVREVRAAVWSVDREQPVWAIRTLESLLGRATAFRRFVTSLLAGYSALAVALAGIGLYGVVAYGVAQRTHEFGVRLALGAEPGQVLQLVLRNGLLLILAGVGVGLAGALTLTRLMGTLLYGVAPHDPATFAGVTLLLLCVALAACWIPARRATRVDPMVALRYE